MQNFKNAENSNGKGCVLLEEDSMLCCQGLLNFDSLNKSFMPIVVSKFPPENSQWIIFKTNNVICYRK